ncbi:MAG TPA: hypothetical protein VMN76_03335, partial [Acidobacteriota bacterium]|nr:hypothetical protein [Acidobacteriota bacterium]
MRTRFWRRVASTAASIQLFLFAGPLVFAFSEGPDDTAAVLGKIVATARGGSDDSIVVATGL